MVLAIFILSFFIVYPSLADAIIVALPIVAGVPLLELLVTLSLFLFIPAAFFGSIFRLLGYRYQSDGSWHLDVHQFISNVLKYFVYHVLLFGIWLGIVGSITGNFTFTINPTNFFWSGQERLFFPYVFLWALIIPYILYWWKTSRGILVIPPRIGMHGRLFIWNITIFYIAGYILVMTNLQQPESFPMPTETPTPFPSVSMEPVTQNFNPISMKFNVGKHYFLDQINIVSKSEPRIILQINAVRSEIATDNFRQLSNIKYFDGTQWSQTSETILTPSANIAPTKLIPLWATHIDESHLPYEKSKVQVVLQSTQFELQTEILTNNMIIRSLPEYTKLVSAGNGTLLRNGVAIPVHVSYARIFSNNVTELPITNDEYYNKNNEILTNWLLFWDTIGNFYFVDVTKIGPNTKLKNYASHMIGMKQSVSGSIQTTFDVQVHLDELSNPRQFTMQLGTPINQTLTFSPNGTLSLSKAFKMFVLGNAQGSVQNVDGYGIFEYIYN